HASLRMIYTNSAPCKTFHTVPSRGNYSFFLHVYSHPPHLHSFPTRRSSDLGNFNPDDPATIKTGSSAKYGANVAHVILNPDGTRSEEHTSELQSRFDLVCRLLLEKKKALNKQAQDAEVLELGEICSFTDYVL